MAGAQADIIVPQFSTIAATKNGSPRRKIYDEGLADLPQVVRPPLRQDGSHIYFYYTIQVDDRDRLARS